jgi:hypothetical protein
MVGAANAVIAKKRPLGSFTNPTGDCELAESNAIVGHGRIIAHNERRRSVPCSVQRPQRQLVSAAPLGTAAKKSAKRVLLCLTASR